MANELNLNIPTEATPSNYSGVFNMPTQATPTNAIPMQISEDIVAVVNDLKQSVYNKQDKLNENQLANINSNHSNYLTEHQDISGKQDKLTAGENITIVGNVISASGGGGGTVNAYTKTETDTLLEAKADASTTYTKTEVDSIKSELNSDIANRLEKNQGAENAGKYLTVAENGNASPTELALKTINNQSIVGSGNIAIGGEEIVTVADFTTTEEIAIISFDKDVNGNAFALKKIIIRFSTEGSVSATVTKMIKINDDYRCTMTISSTNNKIQSWFYIDATLPVPFMVGAAGNDSQPGTNSGYMHKMYNMLPITKIATSDYIGGNIPIGVTIKIYGVKA